MSETESVGRRQFVMAVTTFLGSIMGAVIGLPAIGYMLSPALKASTGEAKIEAGPVENYPENIPTAFTFTRTKVNGWEKTVNSYGVYIIRTGEQVTALSNRCTHLSCRVKWNDGENAFHCPCHDAAFDKQGQVISGPPPRALDKLPATIENGKIYIEWKEG